MMRAEPPPAVADPPPPPTATAPAVEDELELAVLVDVVVDDCPADADEQPAMAMRPIAAIKRVLFMAEKT